MTVVKQRKLRRKPVGLFKRHAAPRGTGASALRASRHALLNEVEESEAEDAIAEAQLARPPAMLEGEVAQAAPKASTPGYTQAGPLALNPAYAGKSDLDRAAQLMRDLDLEPGTSHGIRVLRAASPYGRKK